jgi:HK97 family phage major capsid protein
LSEQALNAAFGEEPKQQSLVQQIGTFAQKLDDIAGEMKAAKDDDTARYQSLREEHAKTAATLTELKAKHDADIRNAEIDDAIKVAAEWKARVGNVREPSKAGIIAAGMGREQGHAEGDFLRGVFMAAGRDADMQAEGKALLSSMGHTAKASASNPGQKALYIGKSTLGTSDATGGWVIPNALVDEFIAPAAITNIYRSLMTVVTGVTAPAVDQPFRSATRTAAAVASFGSTKENLDLAYNGYTVTMYTLARIYDIGNQFLRQSQGAAERDVMSELAAAFAQGESNYIREGTGTSQPFGYTSALNNAQPSVRSAFTASATTLAGSIAKAVATAAGALAGRGVSPTAGVLSAASYWNMVSQGTDSAGFFFAPSGGPGTIRPGTLMSPFGLPIYADAGADLVGTAAVTDNLTIADWKAFKLYLGQSYRVDSSDQAGSRWDLNITGFRGEEEMGFDARPAVYAGYAQQIQDIEP